MCDYVNDTSHDIWEHGAATVRYEIVHDEEERKKLENFLIALHDPVCNRRKPKPMPLMGLGAVRPPVGRVPLWGPLMGVEGQRKTISEMIREATES